MRTRYLAEVEVLHELGADEVIPEEYETALAIFQRVLHHFDFAPEAVERLLEEVRCEDYAWLRDQEAPQKTVRRPRVQAAAVAQDGELSEPGTSKRRFRVFDETDFHQTGGENA